MQMQCQSKKGSWVRWFTLCPISKNGTLVDGETTEHRNTFLTIAGIGQNPAEDIRSTILGGANLQFKQAP